MENIEIEYKVMIDQSGYIKMKKWMEEQKFVLMNQINQYYDTQDGRLKKNKISLRIRSFLSKKNAIMTLKTPAIEGRKEYEFVIEKKDLSAMPNEIENLLQNYNVKKEDLFHFASLQTLRHEIQYEDTIICLDYNTYNGRIDYEMECEAKSMKKAQETLIMLLHNQRVLFKQSSLSKMERARESSPYFVK